MSVRCVRSFQGLTLWETGEMSNNLRITSNVLGGGAILDEAARTALEQAKVELREIFPDRQALFHASGLDRAHMRRRARIALVDAYTQIGKEPPTDTPVVHPTYQHGRQTIRLIDETLNTGPDKLAALWRRTQNRTEWMKPFLANLADADTFDETGERNAAE